MEAVMKMYNSRYEQFVTKMNRTLGSRRAMVLMTGLMLFALSLLMQAHAGAGGTSFAAIATRIEGWAQGDLGLAIVAGGLIFGVASMVFTGRGTVLAIVVGGAVALYYGIPVLEKIFAATGGAHVAKTLIVHGARAAGMV
jgi:conjugal transfer pilus assembly protein TraA